MNDLEQEIAIAKACGWEHTKTVNNPDPSAYGRHPIYTADVTWDLPLPDYLNDLNAMHEAETALSEVQFGDYFDELESQMPFARPQHKRRHVCSATARQRAEALLKTLNLWKP